MYIKLRIRRRQSGAKTILYRQVVGNPRIQYLPCFVTRLILVCYCRFLTFELHCVFEGVLIFIKTSNQLPAGLLTSVFPL